MSTEALCQDCLRVCFVADVDKDSCECGGQVCCWPGCMATLQELRAGERDKRALGLQVEISDWNEQTGCVVVENSQSTLTTQRRAH